MPYGLFLLSIPSPLDRAESPIIASRIAILNPADAVILRSGTDSPAEKPGWKLTFQDEFDRPLLNDMYWFAA
jgi:hypothetical protein